MSGAIERAVAAARRLETMGAGAQAERLLSAAGATRELAALYLRQDRLLEAERALGPGGGALEARVCASLRQRADSLLHRERLEEAKPFIERLLARRPKDAEALTLRGRWLRRSKRFAEAAAVFSKAAGLHRFPIRPALHAAEALLWTPRAAKAPEVLRAALAAQPQAAIVPRLLERYTAAFFALDLAEAERMGEAVLDRTREYKALRTLGWLLLVYDYRPVDYPEVYLKRLRAEIAKYRRRRPGSVWGRYWGLCFPKIENPDPSGLESVAARHEWMLYEAGKCRFYKEEFREAASDFARAARSTEPAHWRALCFEAESLWCLGDLEAGLKRFESAERAAGPRDFLGMRAWKAEVLLWAGRAREALEILGEADPAGPSDLRAWQGAALVLLGRPREALAPLADAVARDPRSQAARLWRAEALLRCGELAAAAREADLALRAERADFFARAMRGWMRTLRGDLAGARADWRALPARARKLAPSFEKLFEACGGVRDARRFAAAVSRRRQAPLFDKF